MRSPSGGNTECLTCPIPTNSLKKPHINFVVAAVGRVYPRKPTVTSNPVHTTKPTYRSIADGWSGRRRRLDRPPKPCGRGARRWGIGRMTIADRTVVGDCRVKRAMLIVSVALAVTACASVPEPAMGPKPEARSFNVSDNASADVDVALARARQSGKRVLLVMGANWCSDSRVLAGWLATDRFAELVERKYEMVFVDIGMPRDGDRPNLGIARRFGIAELPGSPNVLVLTSDGVLVNPTTATRWRNAEGRTGDAIYDELATLADLPVRPIDQATAADIAASAAATGKAGQNPGNG